MNFFSFWSFLNPRKKIMIICSAILSVILVPIITYYLYIQLSIPAKKILFTKSCPQTRQNGSDKFYSANYEDYIINIGFQDQIAGLYIFIGNSHYKTNSSTYKLYENKWKGVNILVNKDYYQEFITNRPRDINLNLNISSQNKILRVLSMELANKESLEKEYIFGNYEIDTKTLDKVIRDNEIKNIDLLIIDSSEKEQDILSSFNIDLFPPKIIIINSRNNQLNPSAKSWETILIAAKYKFLLFDGANQYYISEDSLTKSMINNFYYAYNCAKDSNKLYDKSALEMFFNKSLIIK